MKMTKKELAETVIELSKKLDEQTVAGTSIPLSGGLKTLDAKELYPQRKQVTDTAEQATIFRGEE